MALRLLLGTKNQGKIREVREVLGSLPSLTFVTGQEVPFSSVVEDGSTYSENATKKASQISKEVGLPVLAEDSGLEVKALGGSPGIHSARYAGPDASDTANINKLLAELKGVEEREARFVSVVTIYISEDRIYSEEGFMEGWIERKPRGKSGFGYDPVFVPQGYERTLAQLGPEVKNRISHRRKALEKLKSKLENEASELS